LISPASFILIIDDDEDIRETVAEVLAMNDYYRVETAANGRDALDKLRAGGRLPSLILLDLMMPVMDGWAFMDEFMKDARLAAIPVVVFSAHGGTHSAAVRSVPAKAFLSKPLTMGELISTVERWAVDPPDPP
jgi:CheY-like chemotaxis protein